jgi:hypothetical protein
MTEYESNLDVARIEVERRKQFLDNLKADDAATNAQMRDARNALAVAEGDYLQVKYFPLSQSVIDVIEKANVDAKDAVFVSKLIADAVKVAIKFPSKRAQSEPLEGGEDVGNN